MPIVRPRPIISVLTPTWNRAGYLKDVWAGLNAQIFRQFEWIVANDGSEDQTIAVVRKLAEQSDFPVTLISASERVGKSRMDNEAVAAARGQYIVWCDSDDYFYPQALQALIDLWLSIPGDERQCYCGVTALCETANGVLGNRFYENENPMDLSWNALYDRLRSDLVIFTRAELLKQNPFLEVDFLISESSVWYKVGVLKTRFRPMALKRVRYGEANALSFSGHMSYSRGHAHAIALTNKYVNTNLSELNLVLRALNYLRYCRHGDISFGEAMALWRPDWRMGILLVCVWPASQLLAMLDSVQGKVRKTHVEFAAAQSAATLDVERLNFEE